MVKKSNFMVCLIVSILINALVIFIIWSSGVKRKEEQEITEIEFLSPTPEEPEEQLELEPEPEPEIEPEPKLEPPIPEKGKVFTVPAEEKAPEPEEDSISPKKKEDDKTNKETKTQDEIAYEAQKFKYEAYAKQVHQKLRQYLPWLKKTYGRGRAVVKFAVHRDGTTSHISILESSGNKSFDDDVIKLVEDITFDNLPNDYEKNILVTAFEFRVGVDN
ncbi:MAG: TonB C-terminal domain-containing protein [Endomicrobium sp.]|jgi:TonB family protein|nr:TonB C-terminal domain-containing protein [Endomicrobium sp.]